MMNDAIHRAPRTSAGRKFFARGLAATLVVAGLGVVAPVTAAEAATARNGRCETGEFCYYYLGKSSSVSDFSVSVSNYGTNPATCYEFRGAGSGQGKCIKNNAMYVWNRSNRAVSVFYGSGYTGTNEVVAAGQEKYLGSALANNNASHKFR